MKQTDQHIIGPTTFVDFPEYTITKIPAKVDTGADSSSLWATNIRETNGVLTFEFFGPASPFYSGHTVSTRHYSLLSVRNSFGQTELRYKVPLKLRINGKTIAARFTLSDRANNAYPILIGRRTIKGKFLVDVAKQSPASKLDRPQRVLVLVHGGGPRIEDFYRQLNEEYDTELHAEVTRYSDLAYYIENKALQIKRIDTGEDIRAYDVIYFKTSIKNAQFASIIAHHARFNHIPFIDEAVERLAPDSKLHQLALLAPSGVGVPQTIQMSMDYMGERYNELAAKLGSPFILKDNTGRKGRNNHLIHSKKEFDQAIATAKTAGLNMLAQEFIPNDGYYRVVVMGKRAVLAMYRPIDHTRSHLFSKSQDGPVQYKKLHELPGEMIAMCITAAVKLDWQIAGVDVVQDKTMGRWYCLEVNNSPQLVSGAFVDRKRAALASFFQEALLSR